MIFRYLKYTVILLFWSLLLVKIVRNIILLWVFLIKNLPL